MLCRDLKFCVIRASYFLLVFACIKMYSRRNVGRRVVEATAWGNQAPPQAPATGVQVPFNPTALTDGEVRAALVQMAQAITAQA